MAKKRTAGEMVEKFGPVVELLQRESDRGCILVGAAYLEEMLADVLAARVVSRTWDERLFSMDGPAGTFSRRIALAGALGFVTEDEAKTLDKLRDIRNTAAHFDRKYGSEFSLSFNSAHVVSLLSAAPLAPTHESVRSEPRLRFVVLFMEMWMRLQIRMYSLEDGRDDPMPYPMLDALLANGIVRLDKLRGPGVTPPPVTPT